MVTVYSHFRSQSWSGEVPDAELDGLQHIGNINEQLFRLFNRVDEADVKRLEEWGYHLPSLSVGDTIAYQGKRFLVADIGFTEMGPSHEEELEARLWEIQEAMDRLNRERQNWGRRYDRAADGSHAKAEAWARLGDLSQAVRTLEDKAGELADLLEGSGS